MYKKQFILLIQILAFLLLINLSPAFAETITLKSGFQVEGKIIESNERYIKIETNGVPITYWADEIEKIDGEPVILDQRATPELASSEAEFKRYETKLQEYFLNRKYEEALFTLDEMMQDEKIKDVATGRADTYRNYGVIYYYLGRFQEAVSSFEKTTNLKTNDPYDYLTLGVLYDYIGQQEEAKQNLLKAIDLFKQGEDYTKVIWAEALLKKIK